MFFQYFSNVIYTYLTFQNVKATQKPKMMQYMKMS